MTDEPPITWIRAWLSYVNNAEATCSSVPASGSSVNEGACIVRDRRCRSVRRGAGPGFPGAVRHHHDQFGGGDRIQRIGEEAVVDNSDSMKGPGHSALLDMGEGIDWGRLDT